MVKGTAKQAVVLHPGDKSGFEQAIFILSPGQSGEKLDSPEDLLRLADSIAEKHTVATLPRVRKGQVWSCILSFLAGGLMTAGVLLLCI